MVWAVLQCSTRTSIFSNIQHYAVYVSTIGSCMPSRHLRRVDTPLTEFTTNRTSHPCTQLNLYQHHNEVYKFQRWLHVAGYWELGVIMVIALKDGPIT